LKSRTIRPNRTASKSQNKTAKVGNRIVIILSSAFVAGFIFFTLFQLISDRCTEASWRSVHNKAVSLGLIGAPREIELRHVEITERDRHESVNGDIPVHILYRTNSTDGWKLCGTGLRFGKNPSAILTAHHVLEKRVGQYACRKISRDAITGKEILLPIESFGSQADDTLILSVGSGTNFPVLSVPTATNIFGFWDIGKEYRTKFFPAKIKLSTCPDLVITNIFDTEVLPGTHHLIFNWEVRPGESGTCASLEGNDEDTYLVVIRGQIIPRNLYEALPPRERSKFVWREDKLFGVGILIKVNQHP